MKYPVASLALATGAIAQSCASSASSTFQIAAIDANATVSSSTATCDNAELLTLSLTDGVLTDAQNRTGYIASNRQFQFDNPVQYDAIVDSGFSVCDGLLALSESTTWWKCWSGDFANLYDQKIADQCEEIKLAVLTCGEESDYSEDVIPICEIGDGQIQAKTTICGTPASTVSSALPTDATDTCGPPTTVTVTVGNPSAPSVPATSVPATSVPATEVPATEAPTTAVPTGTAPTDTPVVPSVPAVTSQTSVDPSYGNSTSVVVPTSIATGSVPSSVSTGSTVASSGSVTTSASPSTSTSSVPVSGGNKMAVGSLGLVAVMFALI